MALNSRPSSGSPRSAFVFSCLSRRSFRASSILSASTTQRDGEARKAGDGAAAASDGLAAESERRRAADDFAAGLLGTAGAAFTAGLPTTPFSFSIACGEGGALLLLLTVRLDFLGVVLLRRSRRERSDAGIDDASEAGELTSPSSASSVVDI